MARYAPILAFWVAFSGSLTFAIHQVWIGAGLCLATALIALFGFADNRWVRWAAILGSVLVTPVAFGVFAIWDSNPLNTLLAMLLAVTLLLIFTATHWTEWALVKNGDLEGIPFETELPKAPDVPLQALRLPGDEASFAIIAAQAMVWFETKNIVGNVRKFLRLMNDKLEHRAMLTVLVGWAFFSGVAALTIQLYAWWMAVVAGVALMAVSPILLFILTAIVLLWLRILTTALLALAAGVEVLFGVGAVTVYAEPLPRWSSHALCHLEILGWTEEDAKQMPPLRHNMYLLGFVHQRVADWIVERLKQRP